MLKSRAFLTGIAITTTVAVVAMAHPALAAGKRIRVDNATPPPTVVNPTTGVLKPHNAWRTPDASNQPGGVVVRTGKVTWRR
jgi:hypothetical protein